MLGPIIYMGTHSLTTHFEGGRECTHADTHPRMEPGAPSILLRVGILRKRERAIGGKWTPFPLAMISWGWRVANAATETASHGIEAEIN